MLMISSPTCAVFTISPITELQQFFDLADLEPERILYAGRKGALAAWRDAIAFKALYGWALRALRLALSEMGFAPSSFDD